MGIFLWRKAARATVKVFRGITADGKPEQVETFATGLNRPYGIAFYPPGPDPQWVYIGNMDSVVRFPYQNGDMKARGPAQHIADCSRQAEPLDARRAVHAGRQEYVRRRGIGFQRG